MVHLLGGECAMGSARFYPEERPVRRTKVPAFRIDVAPVTNRDFAAFVEATGHRTVAETPLDPGQYPGADIESLRAGSMVFTAPDFPVQLNDWRQWWRFFPGADWRHPQGPDSSIAGLEDHPVVHVAFSDAAAYAEWAGKSLPTEAMWEYAARGGHEDGREYQWGHSLAPDGQILANYWQGDFPHQNLCADGWERTSPIKSYPPNNFGIYDLIGNVWEWTIDQYAMPGVKDAQALPRCCAGEANRGVTPGHTHNVIKGGSHLCAENYCQRYRPAARQGQRTDSPASHIGFRCVIVES